MTKRTLEKWRKEALIGMRELEVEKKKTGLSAVKILLHGQYKRMVIITGEMLDNMLINTANI
ncbi:hypothetical protein KO465_04905 [Candidatus Micrarchaeota archaeon]|jgi:hypothetical protein|nr:hypothetical protein [Candidatus Micrarchaeota archaeon]